MSYTLQFEHPNYPEDYEFGFPNLGVVKNGSTLEIDEDTERQFVASQGKSVEDAFADNSLVSLSGSSTIAADELNSLLPEPDVQEEPVSVLQDLTHDDENEGGGVDA